MIKQLISSFDLFFFCISDTAECTWLANKIALHAYGFQSCDPWLSTCTPIWLNLWLTNDSLENDEPEVKTLQFLSGEMNLC